MSEDSPSEAFVRLSNLKERQCALMSSIAELQNNGDYFALGALFERLAKLTDEEAQIYREHALTFKQASIAGDYLNNARQNN